MPRWYNTLLSTHPQINIFLYILLNNRIHILIHLSTHSINTPSNIHADQLSYTPYQIPAILLNVHHTHTVLDVCSAPGSKTEQLLALMQNSKDMEAGVVGGDYTGMVVANDADPKRIQTLRRRYARCGRPNLLIHCSRAEDLCRLMHRRKSPSFDRVVSDVPCSGDGTW